VSREPAYECDLHTHTLRSDGNDSYLELIERAAALGMKAIAITDHDVAPALSVERDGKAISPVEYARDRGLCLLLGAEYSCDTDVDDVHIVALGCEWGHEGLRREEERMRRSKIDGYRRLTRLLSERGFPLSWDEVLENGGHPLPESEIQRKHIFEAMARKKYAPTWREAKLLVRGDAELNLRREKTDPREAIRLIHEAGGVAILAHPFLIDPVVVKAGGSATRAEYIASLVRAGLDGIEASYTYDKTSYEGKRSPEELEREIRQEYDGHVQIISGGSDYHADAKKGIANPRRIGERGVAWEYFRRHPLLARIGGLA